MAGVHVTYANVFDHHVCNPISEIFFESILPIWYVRKERKEDYSHIMSRRRELSQYVTWPDRSPRGPRRASYAPGSPEEARYFRKLASRWALAESNKPSDYMQKQIEAQIALGNVSDQQLKNCLEGKSTEWGALTCSDVKYGGLPLGLAVERQSEAYQKAVKELNAQTTALNFLTTLYQQTKAENPADDMKRWANLKGSRLNRIPKRWRDNPTAIPTKYQGLFSSFLGAGGFKEEKKRKLLKQFKIYFSIIIDDD